MKFPSKREETIGGIFLFLPYTVPARRTATATTQVWSFILARGKWVVGQEKEEKKEMFTEKVQKTLLYNSGRTFDGSYEQ